MQLDLNELFELNTPLHNNIHAYRGSIGLHVDFVYLHAVIGIFICDISWLQEHSRM
jgi:hypothetical protein